MAKFDVELFRDYILQIVVDNIDAKIDEINTEKNDSIILTKPDSAHFIHTLNDQALAFDPFIHYGLSAINTEAQGGSVKWVPQMFISFYFIDRGQGDIAESKVLRYTRAITEILADKATANSLISTLEILPLPPAIVTLADQDGSNYKVGAVEIKGSFVT